MNTQEKRLVVDFTDWKSRFEFWLSHQEDMQLTTLQCAYLKKEFYSSLCSLDEKKSTEDIEDLKVLIDVEAYGIGRIMFHLSLQFLLKYALDKGWERDWITCKGNILTSFVYWVNQDGGFNPPPHM